MNQKITTFYRLTKQEKDRLVEQCRGEIEERKVRELEEVRKILEELLETKWETKKKTAQREMQKLLDDLQRQVTEAQERERRNSADTGELRKKLDAAELRNSELSGDLALANGKANNSQERLNASETRVVGLAEKLTDAEKTVSDLQGKLTASNESLDTLRRLYSTSEKTTANLRKLHSEDARRI